MECEAAREAMLECEPTELDGVGETELAAHLRTCAACHRRAATLVAELGALDEALAELAAGSARGVAAVPGGRRVSGEAVRPESAEPAGNGLRGSEGGRLPPAAHGARGLAAGVSGNARWQRLWRLAAPVAVAAALAVLILAWPRGGPGPGASHPAAVAGGPPASVDAAVAPRPELRIRVPTDARVAVFQTRDPSVAVVWFFPAPNGG